VRKIFEIGGIAAGIVLIAFGIAAIVLGVNGKNTVASSLKEQAIVGTPDMTPAAIKAEAAKAGLPATIKLPTCTVAGKAVTDGATARCFADYMRIHAYESTGGQPYSQMGRFLDANGQATNDESKAAINPETKRPVENGARNIWVTETALTTALNMSYMADQLGNFGIVVGIALLLSGFGFVILAVGGALRAGGWLFARNAAKATTKSTIAVGA
jgi:hypothetical protein